MTTEPKPTIYKQYSRKKIKEQAAAYRQEHPVPEKKKVKRSTADVAISWGIKITLALILYVIFNHKQVSAWFKNIFK